MPPLPLITYALHREYGQGERASYELAKAQHILEPNLWPSTLPSAFCPAIEEMVETEGLNDLHVHLNGTTEADLVWLDALSKPQVVYQELKKGYNTPPGKCVQPVREQYDQIEPGLTPEKVYRRLTLARFLRYALTEYLFNNNASTLRHLNVQIDGKNAPTRDDTLVRGMRHPVKVLNRFGGLEEPLCEALFLWSAFQALSEEEADNEASPLAPSLHLYLLIAGQFNRFIVQQIDQNGFDQFQKITVNEFRTHSEREYQRRFNQLARRDHNDLVFLEGRFAPGDGVSGNWERLSRILYGYALFQNAEAKALSPHTLNIAGPHRMKLGLVAHFIKETDRSRTEPSGLCRHNKLRRTVERRAIGLLALHRRSPLVKRFLMGIDAASNELHAPPEVFAPVFRRFRDHDFTNFTFHAGEDFRHLLSGMRAVVEAVQFLDLRSGNRIGHGTALGLDPMLWLKRIGERIVLPRGEWLDDLIFAYAMLSGAGVMPERLLGLRDRIGREARMLYQDNQMGPDDLVQAWRLRDLDPLLALNPNRSLADTLDRTRRREWNRILAARKRQQPAYDLYCAYHSSEVRKRWGELVETTGAEIGIDLLVAVQKISLQMLVQREIVLEAMPTSNVRIGVYEDYDEHHVFRWLALDGDLPKPAVVLASDDPGIFANCLRNEFLHLYQALIAHPGVSKADAMKILKDMNQNGRVYRFRSHLDEQLSRSDSE